MGAILGGIGKFFAGLGTKAKNVLADAEKHMNSDVLEGIVAGMAMIVMADGKADESEIQMACNAVKSHSILSKYPEGDTTVKLMGYIEQLKATPTSARLTMKSKLLKLKPKHEQAILAIAIACDIAGADNDFDAKEKALILEWCKDLGCDPKDFGGELAAAAK